MPDVDRVTVQLSDNLEEPFAHQAEFFVGRAPESLADPLARQRADLAHLDPGTLWKLVRREFERQPVSCPGFLARQGHRDDRPRAFVENIVAEDQDRRSPASRARARDSDRPSGSRLSVFGPCVACRREAFLRQLPLFHGIELRGLLRQPGACQSG